MTNFEASLVIDAIKGAIVLEKIANSCYEDRADKVSGQEAMIEALDKASKALRLIDAGIDKILDKDIGGRE